MPAQELGGQHVEFQFVTVTSEANPLRRIDVLIAVEPPALLRFLEHLLERPEFRVVARISNWKALIEEVGRLQPALIICNADLFGQRAAQVIGDLKLASPSSRLLLISFVHELERLARKWGADAYLEDEDLVRHLIPTARKLARSRTARRNPKRTANTRTIASLRSSAALDQG
jgi:DNA-binding NarL/FixJ family response regulator